MLLEVWHIRHVSLQLLLLNSSARLRSISLGSLLSHPETGCAASATTALSMTSRQLADTATSWAADICKGSWFSKQSHLFWKSHPSVVPEQQWSILGRQPRGWEKMPRSWHESCPRSACILWGTVRSCWGACGSRCPLETSQKHCGRGQVSTSHQVKTPIVVSFLFSRDRNNHHHTEAPALLLRPCMNHTQGERSNDRNPPASLV